MKKIFGLCRKGNKGAVPWKNRAWQDWCETVLAQVRFQPDHKAIQWRENHHFTCMLTCVACGNGWFFL